MNTIEKIDAISAVTVGLLFWTLLPISGLFALAGATALATKVVHIWILNCIIGMFFIVFYPDDSGPYLD